MAAYLLKDTNTNDVPFALQSILRSTGPTTGFVPSQSGRKQLAAGGLCRAMEHYYYYHTTPMEVGQFAQILLRKGRTLPVGPR